jgi:acyl carrier protein
MDLNTMGGAAQAIKAIIIDSLDLDVADLSLSENLIQDLGAESLDFLDIIFRIEEQFGARVERGRIERQLKERFGDLEIKPNTDLTAEMKVLLADVMPEVPVQIIDQLRKVKEIARTFTVASFVRIANEARTAANPALVITGDACEGFDRRQLGCGKVLVGSAS